MIMKPNFKKHFLTLITSCLIVSCVQQEHEKEITFKVVMQENEKVESIGLRHQFTSPPWQVTIPLEDEDGDGVFEVQIVEQTAQSVLEFKFVDSNDNFELEGKPNRVLEFEYYPQIISYSAEFNVPNGKKKTDFQ